MPTKPPDFTVSTRGHDVLIVAESDRAKDWYLGDSQPEQWPYFHWRRYGLTPFGWYWKEWDEGFDTLLKELKRRRFKVQYAEE